VRRAQGIGAGRVFVAGLSAGGAMAAVMAEEYPEMFAAAGVHSGLPAGAARSMPEALTAMRVGGAGPSRQAMVPMIVFHGDADQTVAPGNGKALAQSIGTGTSEGGATAGRRWTRVRGPGGEYWTVRGMGHAWSGGSATGSYADPSGPDASAEMLRFFLEHLDRGPMIEG
jgi:poly(3-hydroxybutyrate) depolymerase